MNKRIRIILNDGGVVEWTPVEYDNYKCDIDCLTINITRTWQAIYSKSAIIKFFIS